MSAYPEPRLVTLSIAESQSMTVLEQARACVLAGVKPADTRRLIRAYASGEATPEELLAGATLLYAIAYELELRRDPALTWEQAQGWRVQLGAGDAATEARLKAEAEARVTAALAYGVPPVASAGDLTMADVEAYAVVRAEAEREAARRPRRRRVHR